MSAMATQQMTAEKTRPAILEFARMFIEPREVLVRQTNSPRMLFRGDRLRFEPLSPDIFVKRLSVPAGGHARNEQLLGSAHAVCLSLSPARYDTLDISQCYEIELVNDGKKTLEVFAWIEGFYAL